MPKRLAGARMLIEKRFPALKHLYHRIRRDTNMNRVTKNIWIGDLVDAKHIDPGEFDWVLNLSHHELDTTTNFHPINDGKGSYAEFCEAADALASMLEHDEARILVHCAAGISRSTTIAATAIAKHRDIEYRHAIRIVRNGASGYEGRACAEPHPELVNYARTHLDEKG